MLLYVNPVLNKLDCVQRRLTKGVSSMREKSYEDRMKEPSSMERRRLLGTTTVLFKHLKACHIKEGKSFFSAAAPAGRTRSNGLTLQESRF